MIGLLTINPIKRIVIVDHKVNSLESQLATQFSLLPIRASFSGLRRAKLGNEFSNFRVVRSIDLQMMRKLIAYVRKPLGLIKDVFVNQFEGVAELIAGKCARERAGAFEHFSAESFGNLAHPAFDQRPGITFAIRRRDDSNRAIFDSGAKITNNSIIVVSVGRRMRHVRTICAQSGARQEIS